MRSRVWQCIEANKRSSFDFADLLNNIFAQENSTKRMQSLAQIRDPSSSYIIIYDYYENLNASFSISKWNL